MKWREPKEWDWEDYIKSLPEEDFTKDYREIYRRFLEERDNRKRHSTLFSEKWRRL